LDTKCTTVSDTNSTAQVWARAAAKGVAATWRCAAVGGFKGESLHAAAFAADGSLMALGGASSVTLWEPSANNHVATLALPPNAGAPVRATPMQKVAKS
jgi:hypothetical protein